MRCGILPTVRQPSFSIARVVSIVLMLALWGAGSPRCVLAALVLGPQPAAAEMHRCCSGKAAGGEERTPAQRKGECCQQVPGLAAGAGDAPVKAPVSGLCFAVEWQWLEEVPEAGSEGVVERATGPPEALSFAEVVLQRSVLSHAPPFAA